MAEPKKLGTNVNAVESMTQAWHCLLADMRDKLFRVVHQPLKETLRMVELDGLVVYDCPLVKHAMELPAMPLPLHIVPEQRELPRRVSGPTRKAYQEVRPPPVHQWTHSSAITERCRSDVFAEQSSSSAHAAV